MSPSVEGARLQMPCTGTSASPALGRMQDVPRPYLCDVPHADLADLLLVPTVWAGATPSSEGQLVSWVIHHHCSYLA